MFPSAGLFAKITCPVSKRGPCERPHCLYRHATEPREMFGSVQKSPILDITGVQNGGAVSDEARDDCLQELERLNKEIETVRHEVEREKRRLSTYQTVQTSSSVSKSAGKPVDRGPRGPSKTRARKYVVDNSRPRTDLEYDPLSNFSAGFSSSAKNGHGSKRARNAAPCEQNEPIECPSRSPSPEPLDDSNEDDVLIIDIPLSPDKKRARVEEVKTKSSLPQNAPPASAAKENRVCSNVSADKENKECVEIPDDDDEVEFSACLEDLQSEAHFSETVLVKSPKLSAQEEKSQVDVPRSELPHSVEKMNPLQPHHYTPKNSLFYEAPAACSDSPCRPQTAQIRLSSQTSQKAAPPESYLQPEGPALSASGLSNRAEASAAHTQPLMTEDKAVIVINSSSGDEDELNYSDVDLSDSDPMEECYRIFMEAKHQDEEAEEQLGVSVEAAEVEQPPEINVKPQTQPGRKRVAHEAKPTEQPVAKTRPSPQVLVPLRGPAVSGVLPSQPSSIQQAQQRASMLTASVKGGQAFVSSSSCPRKPETQSVPVPPPQTPDVMQPAPVQNAYMNYIPLGTTVIGVGHNLHLILPEGAFPLPVTSGSGPVTSVLTPITQVHTSAARHPYHPPTATAVHRYRPTASVLIPAQALKPSLTSSFTSAHSAPAAPAAPPAAVKPVPTKRKLKQQLEAKDKVPHDVRQRYVNMFTEEFLKTTANVNEAFEKALAEEKVVFNRSVNKLKYLSVAVNALKRLKNQSAVAAKGENEASSQRSKGNIPLNVTKFKGDDDVALYESLKDYVLTEESLVESNYPVQHPEKPGCAALFADSKKGSADPLKRICCRCGATYSVNQAGKHTRKEECNYHYGRGVTKRVPGGVETRYSCCEGVMGAPGCQVFQLHVHDSLSLDGFVSTVHRRPSDTSCPGVFSLDCEMCYTVHGLELCRVTVVNSGLQVVYDTFVRPDHEVIDYNSRFSGISEQDVKGNHTSLREVQQTLLSFISADTVLIGHGLETDLCALKLLHGTVVDTSVVFPHRLGPPHKLSLNKLTADYLRRIIQQSVCGHDTAEDAAACMELMLWKLKEDGKLKK